MAQPQRRPPPPLASCFVLQVQLPPGAPAQGRAPLPGAPAQGRAPHWACCALLRSAGKVLLVLPEGSQTEKSSSPEAQHSVSLTALGRQGQRGCLESSVSKASPCPSCRLNMGFQAPHPRTVGKPPEGKGISPVS